MFSLIWSTKGIVFLNPCARRTILISIVIELNRRRGTFRKRRTTSLAELWKRQHFSLRCKFIVNVYSQSAHFWNKILIIFIKFSSDSKQNLHYNALSFIGLFWLDVMNKTREAKDKKQQLQNVIPLLDWSTDTLWPITKPQARWNTLRYKINICNVFRQIQEAYTTITFLKVPSIFCRLFY